MAKDSMAPVSIRLATAADLSAMTRIVTAAYRGYIVRIGKPPAPMLDDYAARIRGGTAWVAVCEGAVAGLIVLLAARDHLLLDNIAVDPARQGRGIGRALLDFATDEARRRALPELRLYTHAHMTENQALYTARGWRETGRGAQDGYERVFMTLAVPPARS